jgi:hypothetical protein
MIPQAAHFGATLHNPTIAPNDHAEQRVMVVSE